MVPPSYTGFSFRNFFQYDWPSLMDGVDPEYNVQDNLSDVWSSDYEFQAVEALADGFVLGNPAARLAFVRAGGNSVNFFVAVDHELLLWIGGMLKRIYTPAITFGQSSSVMLPLNPFKVIQHQLNVLAAACLGRVAPEPDVLSDIFCSTFQLGAAVVPRVMLQESYAGRSISLDVDWEMDARSPGLKAIPQLVSGGGELQTTSLLAQGTALQVIASSSQYAAPQSRNALVPLDTTAVRRSTRSNKYDGFKVNQITDSKRSKSRVKPRGTPFISAVSLAVAPVQVAVDACPPPTSVEELQQMCNRCGIAPDALSSEKLLGRQRSSSEVSD